MKKLAPALALLLSLWAGIAVAQTTPTSDQLYKRLGEKAGLVTLMDDFMVRLLADKRTNPFFKEADQKRVKEQLVDQFCELSGGPCQYKGKDMVKAHAGVDITKAHFNALVEVLQLSLDAQGVPFRVQNQLLAQLAPMYKTVINYPEPDTPK